MRDTNMEVSFRPEYHPAVTMFFQREHKRRSWNDADAGMMVWEGEFEPVQFQKKDLLAYLTKYSTYFNAEVKDALKNLKLTQRRSSETETISIEMDDEVERTVEEVQEKTNLPRRFSANMPLFDGGYEVELEFEARVKRKNDGLSETKQKIIELRCTNAREALKEMMMGIVRDMPKEIPIYYGKLQVGGNEKD